MALPLSSYASCDSNVGNEYPSFKAVKKWPLHPEITIQVTASFKPGSSYSQPEDEMGLYDIYIELLNTKSGKKIAHFCDEGALSSDSIKLNHILIDTAPYILSKNTHAFGVRASYSDNSRSNPAGTGTITLFGFTNGKISRLLKTTDAGGHFNEIDINTECGGSFSEWHITISISNVQHNGLSDLLISTVKNQGELTRTANDCIEKSSGESISKSTLTFNGNEYY